MPRLTKAKASELARFILEQVEDHPGDVVRLAAAHFDVSRQTAFRHVQKLVSSGAVNATGERKARRYEVTKSIHVLKLDVVPGLEEHEIWRKEFAPRLKGFPENIFDICHYGFTEMVNNVIDHSGSAQVLLSLETTAMMAEMMVRDYGVGIFAKLQHEFGLSDPRHALLELAKGKLTSDSAKHTGEGIFFTSRMFDKFSISSGTLFFSRLNLKEDWLIETQDQGSAQGTTVFLRIGSKATRTSKEVLDGFAAEHHEFGFSKTHVPITLAQYEGEKLVSRSQAKRLLARFNLFKEVILDFKGVEMIGQAFADEVFRVYQNEHPDTHIWWIQANEHVTSMIHRARSSMLPEAGPPVQS